MRDEAEKRIGHLYPKVEITDEMVNERPDLEPYRKKKLTVIAWIWARTVKSPNPAFSEIEVPLATSFILSNRKGKEAWLEAAFKEDLKCGEGHVANRDNHYRFHVRIGSPPPTAKQGTSAGARKAFRCLISGVPMDFEYLRAEGCAGRMGTKLMAVVALGNRERVYISPTPDQEAIAGATTPNWKPETPIPSGALSIRVPLYGMNTHGSLFTDRQLVGLTTFNDLINEVKEKVKKDAVEQGIPDDARQLAQGGCNATAYSDSISVYLAFALSRMTNYSSTLCVWSSHAKDELAKQVFMRQSLPMTWDFAETNPFSSAGGTLDINLKYLVKCFAALPATTPGSVSQANAVDVTFDNRIVSTDPPYYDNVGYADLSDFFYCWLRRSLREVFPDLLATMAVPKSDELIAAPSRHGGREQSELFFLNGMTMAMANISKSSCQHAPVTIFYAFKQADTQDDDTISTGWETFLDALIRSGMSLTGTWPMRTELVGNLKGKTNSLASSIVLVCRTGQRRMATVSRREFIRELNASLPAALDAMTREQEGLPSPVAPVDLSQAIIGPGMAIFSKYSAVLEADGSPMTVRTALQLINRFLAEDDFDADTQFCLHWFDQYGWESGVFGEADVLARAKATSVSGLVDSGVLRSGGGKAQLLRWSDFSADWNPNKDLRIPIWEVLHQLIRALRQSGESSAGKLLAFGNVQSRAEAARQLAYRLYTLCERKGWAEDARAYNELITSWSAIESATPQTIQTELF